MIRKVDYKEVVANYLHGKGYFVAMEHLVEQSAIYSNVKQLALKKGWIYRIEAVSLTTFEVIDFQYGNTCFLIKDEKMGEYIFEHYLHLVTDMHEEIHAIIEQDIINPGQTRFNLEADECFKMLHFDEKGVISAKMRYMDLPRFANYSREYVQEMVTPILKNTENADKRKATVKQKTVARLQASFEFNIEVAELGFYHNEIEGAEK